MLRLFDPDQSHMNPHVQLDELDEHLWNGDIAGNLTGLGMTNDEPRVFSCMSSNVPLVRPRW